jgi:hypothetical protein
MARTLKTQTDSTDVDVQQPADQGFDGLYTPPPVEIEIASAPKGGAGDKKHFDELKFNEDVLEVMVHESTDSNAENPIFTACNGVTQYFYRGQVQRVKRKFVAILAACKEHSINTPEYTLGDGSRGTKIVTRSSLKYPFSVISDPAGKKGADWLKTLLHAPT